MRHILFESYNRSKITQVKHMFEGLPVSIITPTDVGRSNQAIEDGKTCLHNALKKARFGHEITGGYVLAEDTGFYIDALKGQPGIYAQRWAGEHKTAEEIMWFTLDKLKHVPRTSRTAFFSTYVVYMYPNGDWICRKGVLFGKILMEPQCDLQPDMPYSAIFVPNGTCKVLAEMSPQEENAISHRGQAFQEIRDVLLSEI